MKTLVVYYSFFGKTKAAASCLAEQIGADLVEMKGVGSRVRLPALMGGAARACLHRVQEILPLEEDIASYDRVIVAGPVWAGHPAPAVKGLIRRYALQDKVTCGVLTCSGDGHKAMAVLRSELELAGSRCANVIAIRMEPAMLHALRSDEIRFLSGEKGKLALKASGKSTHVDDTLAKDVRMEGEK